MRRTCSGLRRRALIEATGEVQGENGDYNGTFSKYLEAAGAVAQQTSLSVFSDLDLGGASKSASRFLHVFAMLNLDYPRSAVGQAPIKIFSC